MRASKGLNSDFNFTGKTITGTITGSFPGYRFQFHLLRIVLFQGYFEGLSPLEVFQNTTGDVMGTVMGWLSDTPAGGATR